MLRPTSALDLALMRRIDTWRLEIVFMGARQRCRQLQREGVQVGRRRIGTLLQRRGI
jgi:putative transposase